MTLDDEILIEQFTEPDVPEPVAAGGGDQLVNQVANIGGSIAGGMIPAVGAISFPSAWSAL